MGLFSRWRRGGGGSGVGAGGQRQVLDREATGADLEHLRAFARSREGVAFYVEPETTATDTTVVAVAFDGEWTRRRVPSVQWAHQFCNKHQVPSYDAALVGVPLWWWLRRRRPSCWAATRPARWPSCRTRGCRRWGRWGRSGRRWRPSAGGRRLPSRARRARRRRW